MVRPGLTRTASRPLGTGVDALVAAGALAAVAATAHTAYNVTRLRRPALPPPVVTEPVSVLIPVRDEAARIEACLRAVLASEGVPHLEVIVLDDDSTDGTAQVAEDVAAGDSRVRIIGAGGEGGAGGALPPGWLGKPWTCHRLARAATGEALVFVDADVVVDPPGVAAAVTMLREAQLDLVSPYPRQECGTFAERLVQPLLQWSWLTTVPLSLAERSDRAELAVANGQFLAVDAAVYRRIGGHEAVRGEVLDDVALLRALKRAGGAGTVVDGSELARCRMYSGWRELRAGYAKSLWCAFGSPRAGVVVALVLGCVYVLPAVAAARGSRVGAIGYAAAVGGRVLTARRTGARVWPDALAHPLSIAAFGYLMAHSIREREHGRLTWKGRPVG